MQPSAPHLSSRLHTLQTESQEDTAAAVNWSRHWSENFSNLSLAELLKHRDLRGIPLKDCQPSEDIWDIIIIIIVVVLIIFIEIIQYIIGRPKPGV